MTTPTPPSRPAIPGTLFGIHLTCGDTLAESVVAGKGRAIALAKKWIADTEGPRDVCVYDLGQELVFCDGSVFKNPDLLGNLVFRKEAQ